MRQQTKFWVALFAITLVCFIDYQMFTEGYDVRKLSSTTRQIGHLAVYIAVIPIGYWAWYKHPMKWLKQLWLITYLSILAFIVLAGALKVFNIIQNDDFHDWVTTVRFFFCTPMPHILLYMLSRIAAGANTKA